MGLDIDRQIALRRIRGAGGIAIANEEVGLADPMGLVVDREPAPRDDSGSSGHGLHGLPLAGVGIVDLDDPRIVEAREQARTRLALVVVASPEQLLQEGRVGQWLAGAQHVELDPLGAGLGERGVSGCDLDGHYQCIVAAGRDTRRDAGPGDPVIR